MTNIITFGCRLNFYESELIKQELEKTENSNDFVVINSCAVTNEAERQVKQTIRKIHRENNDKKIIVVGCAAQLNPEKYLALDGVHKVLGNIEKLNNKNYSSEDKILVGNISETIHQPITKVVKFTQKSRGFIQIQNGCDHDCTFCAITHARGNNRSIPIENIIEEIRAMVSNGYKEVVLTGVDITDYGKDFSGKPILSLLIKRILSDVEGLPRLRLSSIDVAEVDDLLIDLIESEKRLMPHIHLSLQSGDPMILKRMKRRHNPDQIYDFCKKVKSVRSNIGFGADIIAGFPTETDKMFENTYSLIKDLEIPYLHVFPYSAKEGTKAALMPQVEMQIRKDRAKKLIKLGKQNLQEFYKKQIGLTHNIVIEKDNIGRSENFCLVKLNNHAQVKEKEIIQSEIYDLEDDFLLGKIDDSLIY